MDPAAAAARAWRAAGNQTHKLAATLRRHQSSPNPPPGNCSVPAQYWKLYQLSTKLLHEEDRTNEPEEAIKWLNALAQLYNDSQSAYEMSPAQASKLAAMALKAAQQYDAKAGAKECVWRGHRKLL